MKIRTRLEKVFAPILQQVTFNIAAVPVREQLTGPGRLNISLLCDLLHISNKFTEKRFQLHNYRMRYF